MAEKKSYATKIYECLSDLAMGKAPRHGTIWRQELWLEKSRPLPESRNKFLICNACELLWAWYKKQYLVVETILDWWTWFHLNTEFTEGEDLTCEEVYRAGMASSHDVASRVAWTFNRMEYTEAPRAQAASHGLWLVAGIGVVPRMSVHDHQHGVSRGVALIGDHRPKFPIVGVAQAGIRGCDRKPNGDFRFTDRANLSMIAYQTIGKEYARKVRTNAINTHNIFTGLNRRWPSSPRWGLDAAQRLMAARFAQQPNNADLAEPVVNLLLPPSLETSMTRFVNNSVAHRLWHDRPSSTDDWIVDVQHASGYAELGTCDDGHRPNGVKQYTTEEATAYACWVDGESQPRVRVRRPDGPVSYVIESKPRQKVRLLRAGVNPTLPPTPPNHEPLPPRDKPSKRFFHLC